MKYAMLTAAVISFTTVSACSSKTSEVKCDNLASGAACEQSTTKKDLPPMPGAKPINYENPTITSATMHKEPSKGASSAK